MNRTRSSRPFLSGGETRLAFALAELVVVLGVVFLLVVVLLGLQRSSIKSREAVCVERLKEVGFAFRLFMGNGDLYPMAASTNTGGTLEYTGTRGVFRHFLAMSNELRSPNILCCPSDFTRRPSRVFGPSFTDTNISYFVGLDSHETIPQMLLAGDRNITNSAVANPPWLLELRTNSTSGWSKALHGLRGNFATADGSVQAYDSLRLRQHLAVTGNSTNRIQLPD